MRDPAVSPEAWVDDLRRFARERVMAVDVSVFDGHVRVEAQSTDRAVGDLDQESVADFLAYATTTREDVIVTLTERCLLLYVSPPGSASS
jgi:hypothetical protein